MTEKIKSSEPRREQSESTPKSQIRSERAATHRFWIYQDSPLILTLRHHGGLALRTKATGDREEESASPNGPSARIASASRSGETGLSQLLSPLSQMRSEEGGSTMPIHIRAMRTRLMAKCFLSLSLQVGRRAFLFFPNFL